MCLFTVNKPIKRYHRDTCTKHSVIEYYILSALCSQLYVFLKNA